MVRASSEDAARSRATIVSTSSRLFRERGIAGVSIADLMQASGLSHGGFYGHFDSKGHLAAEACSEAFCESVDKWTSRVASGGRQAIVDAYLAPKSRDDRGASCPTAALAADVAREPADAPIRDVFAAGLDDLLKILATVEPGPDDASRRSQALSDYALLMGALLMARATAGTPLSTEILQAARARLALPALAKKGSEMFAKSASRYLGRKGVHYSWLVMAIAFLTMLTSSAALGLPGALLLPLGQEFHWTTEQISSALAIRFILFGLLGPFAAILMERYGLKRIVCSALLLIASCMLLSTQMTSLWQLFLLWGLVLGFGTGFTALVLGATIANRWFDQRRGLVLGILTASSATGQLIFLPIAASLIAHHGWRYAVLPVFAMCLVVAGLAFCFLRDRPQDIGLVAFGGDPAESSAVPQGRMAFSMPLTMLGEASRSPAFWVLAGTFFVCGLSTSGLIQTHFITLCGDYGLGAVPAASLLAMIGAFDFVGTICSGWLSDRFDNRKLLFWYYGLRGLSLIWLPHSTFTLYGLSFFAIFYGLDWIATVPPTVKLAGSVFGKERAPMVFGWIFAAHQLGSAIAAWGGGLSRTVLFSYTPALYVAGGACLVAAVGIFLLKRPGVGTGTLLPKVVRA